MDKAYGRDCEEPVPWAFAQLRDPSELLSSKTFYPLNEFQLHGRSPLAFPDYCLVTRNHYGTSRPLTRSDAVGSHNLVHILSFSSHPLLRACACSHRLVQTFSGRASDRQWLGDRRLKNCVVSLEWIPILEEVQPRSSPSGGGGATDGNGAGALSKEQREQLDKALTLFDVRGTGHFDASAVAAVLEAFGDEIVDAQSVLSEFGNGRWIEKEALADMLVHGRHHKIEDGRRMVLLSLAEAETIRAIMHLRQGGDVITGETTQLALRVATCDDAVIDATLYNPTTFEPSLATPPCMARAAHNCIRFLDSAMHYTSPNLATLLRSLGASPMAQRRLFFSAVIGCRRRLTKRWEETPLRHVFALRDAWALLAHQAMVARYAGRTDRTHDDP